MKAIDKNNFDIIFVVVHWNCSAKDPWDMFLAFMQKKFLKILNTSTPLSCASDIVHGFVKNNVVFPIAEDKPSAEYPLSQIEYMRAYPKYNFQSETTARLNLRLNRLGLRKWKCKFLSYRQWKLPCIILEAIPKFGYCCLTVMMAWRIQGAQKEF